MKCGSLVLLNEIFASARDLARWREGNPGQDRIRHKQRSPHPAAAGRVPSIYSVPHIDLTFLRAEEGAVFCVWFLFARTSRTGPRRKIEWFPRSKLHAHLEIPVLSKLGWPHLGRLDPPGLNSGLQLVLLLQSAAALSSEGPRASASACNA